MSEDIGDRRSEVFKGNTVALNSCLEGQNSVTSANNEGGSNESLPLLSVPQSKTLKIIHSRSKKSVLFLICFFLFFSVIILLQKLTHQSQSLMLEAMNQKIGTPFVELLDNRISVVTDGTLLFDYDKIGNAFHRTFIKIVSQVVGRITLEQKSPLDIYVSGLAEKCKLARAMVSSVDLNTRNKVKSAFHLAIDIEVLEEHLQDIISELLSHDNERFGLVVTISGNVLVKKKSHMHISRNIKIDKTIPIDRSNIKPKLQINDISISQNKESSNWINMDIQLIMNKAFPMYLEIQPINWSVFVKDCGKNAREIGRLSTETMVFLSEKKSTFSATGVIQEIDNSLLQICQDSEMSILNEAFKNALDQTAIAIYIKANDDEANKTHLPRWLFNMLSKFEFQVLIRPPPLSLKDKTEFKKFIVNYFETDLISNENRTTFEILLNLNLFIELYLPIIGLDFSISQFKVISNISKGEEIIKTKLLSNSSEINVRHHHHNYDVLLDPNRIEVEMDNPKEIGRWLNEHVWGTSNQPLQIDAILEISFECPLFSTTLRNLRIPQFSLEGKKEPPQLENILKKGNMSVEQITYLDSTSESLQGILDISFYNPIDNFAFGMPGGTASFALGYQNLLLATIRISEVEIANGSSGQMSIPLEINLDSLESWSALQDFLNYLILGKEDLCLSITGAPDILSLEPLGILLQEVTIECVRLAPSVFSQPDLLTDTQSYRSPFVIELVAHLIGTSIEFTIYNPFSNLRLGIWLYRSIATYEGNLIAATRRRQYFEVAPGISKSPRIPVTIVDRTFMDLLRKALNSELSVGVEADFRLQMDQLALPLSYNDTDTTFKVRL